MSESLLRKEFKKSDVERARNLISGNYSNSTKTIVGYAENRLPEKHNEGDVWEEGGKQWTIEDGLKVSVSKLEKARKIGNIPLLCPKCGKPMTTRLDKKMYPIHRMCFDCVVKFEDDLKRAGLYQEYERQMISKNIQSFVTDLKSRIESMKSESKVTITTDEGTLEDWGTVSSALVDGLEEWANLLSEQIN